MRATNIAASLLIAVLATLAAACASKPAVRTDSDPSANLASYKTFAFFDRVATDKSSYSTVITSRLKEAVRRELLARGYQETEDNPQLLVNFSTNVENRADVQSTPSSMGFYGYRAGMYGAWAGYPQDVYTTHYQEGTLAIDIVDAQKRQLVWQGVAQARITKDMLENPGETIDSVVSDIFAKYPVAPTTAAAR